VIVTNFETISTEQDRLQLFLKTRNVAIIIDESTKIKNPESKLTQDFFAISALFKIKVIMTGTPVANRPYDIWAQIYFLDEGHSLGTNFAEFKAMCDLSNDLQEDESKRMIFEDSVAGIYNKIKDFSVRETKNSGIITLPSKIYHDVTVGFEQKQFEMYETLRKDMELTLTRGDETILDESTETIKRLLRLVQITSNPKLIDESYVGESAKEILLDQLIERIISQDEMVIVWSIYTGNIDMFCKKYAKYGAVKITGKMAVEERNKSVAAFKSGKAKLLFATPQSAKEGLTLTIANNAIFYDRGFNLDDYLQAQDRIHRISQKRDCHIYNLMVEDSIDIWIDYLLKAKQRAAFLAQGDINLRDYKDEADYSFANIVHEILNTN
jgi:SNF2 family DNA or RNA helicase